MISSLTSLKGFFLNGVEAWHLTAIACKEEFEEDIIRDEDDIHRNWTRKLCNNFKMSIGVMRN
jgi:hypothetical protein